MNLFTILYSYFTLFAFFVLELNEKLKMYIENVILILQCNWQYQMTNWRICGFFFSNRLHSSYSRSHFIKLKYFVRNVCDRKTRQIAATFPKKFCINVAHYERQPKKRKTKIGYLSILWPKTSSVFIFFK